MSIPDTDTLSSPKTGPAPQIWGIHLLDHDPAGHAAVAEFLGKAGFRVTASSNAPDALDYVARSRPDLLITSMESPGLSLPHFVHQVKILSRATRVLLSSVRSDWGAYEEARIYGAAGLITRPIHRMTLLRAVERVIERDGVPAKGMVTG